MKHRIRSSVSAIFLSCALLAPVAVTMPATAAESDVPAASASVITQDNAQQQLDQIDQVIDDLNVADRAVADSKTDYAKEIRDLLATAWELRTSIAAIAAGGPPPFDVATIVPRVQLLTEITNIIKVATTELTTKVEDAHVQIGFSVSRAIIRLGNPSATVDQINTSIKELRTTVEKARTYRDVGPDDRATIYVKAKLDKAIWETRFARDANILGKAPSSVYFALNKKITHAVGVWLNPAATVAQVNAEITALQAAYDEAAAQLP